MVHDTEGVRYIFAFLRREEYRMIDKKKKKKTRRERKEK